MSVRFLKKISAYNEATETCNTAMERKFCWLSEDNFENCEKSFYEAQFSFFWQVAESANKPIFKVLVNLRSLSYMWKLPWSMTINTRILQSH